MGKHLLLKTSLFTMLFVVGGMAHAEETALQKQLSKLRSAVQESEAQSGSTIKPISQTPIPANQPPPGINVTPQSGGADGPEAPPPLPPQVQQNDAQNASSQGPRKTSDVDLHERAFIGMTNQVLPMSPGQIYELKKLFKSIQESAGRAAGVPPRMTSSAVQVKLEPGATPPVIRLRSGYVSSLVFVDATGAPWPIKAYDIGDPRSFNVQWDKEGHILLVQAISQFKSGNLAVVLKGLNTPVMLTLLPGQAKVVDSRVDLRIPAMGPNASPSFTGLPSTTSPALLNVLNGIPLVGSRKLKISQCESCDLWELKGKMFLRTRYTLLSPGWISTMSSPDGTHAYEFEKSPVLLLSRNGKLVTVSVKGM